MGVDGRSLPGKMPPYRHADLPHGWKPDGLLPTHSSGDGGPRISPACGPVPPYFVDNLPCGTAFRVAQGVWRDMRPGV